METWDIVKSEQGIVLTYATDDADNTVVDLCIKANDDKLVEFDLII